MALPDLTGQNIENTYNRILQTDGTYFYDGTGSLVNIITDSSSFAITGSNTFFGTQTITGSLNTSGAISASYFEGIINGGQF